MPKEKCPFCEELQKLKDDERWYKENSPRHKDSWNEYTVSLVVETYEKDVDWCTGRFTQQAMKLNFCPVCGVKLNKE